jgi:hypothetical protein
MDGGLPAAHGLRAARFPSNRSRSSRQQPGTLPPSSEAHSVAIGPDRVGARPFGASPRRITKFSLRLRCNQAIIPRSVDMFLALEA